MNLYTVHTKKHHKTNIDNTVLVKEGFCWPALFFGFLWFLYNKMWIEAAIVFAINVLLTLVQLQGYGHLETYELIKLGIALLLAANFNDLLRNNLTRNKYKLQDVVSGSNTENAEVKYLTNMLHRNTFVSGHNF